ncbi:M20/M25/M40 family metallo-hydrolase [Demequina sp. SO4-13]|uniref:M20/M25/M40 family metallo-hydrolase n=1 Tax=Demequina sp. SO4-13 TaxID=3401027 RepID=UPI003AF57619
MRLRRPLRMLKRASAALTAAPTGQAPDVRQAQRAAEHLARLVRIPTVTPPPGPLSKSDAALFAAYREELEALYPRVFAAAEVETTGRAGLLLRVPGQFAERPVLLMAHQDVVPVPVDWAAEGWEHPPFDGVIAGGRVHGRGTLDDKGAMVVALEALESLLTDGWSPLRDLYLFFGGDEESHGAAAVEAVRLLEERGVEPWMVLDEGGAVATQAFPTLRRPMAVIGASEKGMMTLRLAVESLGGHASTPPRQSAPGILAHALVAIEDKPFPTAVHDVTIEMLEGVAPHVARPMRALLKRAGRRRSLLGRVVPRLGPELAAMVRTTAAITQLEGSPAQNVLATRATAVINVRVAVGSTCDEAVAHLRAAIDDPRVDLEILEASEPSPVSPTGDDARWRALGAAVSASYPDAVTVPYIMLAASDARHVARISPAVYRFSPLAMNKAQREAIHGPNESVEISALGAGVTFYRALLTGDALGPSDPAAS